MSKIKDSVFWEPGMKIQDFRPFDDAEKGGVKMDAHKIRMDLVPPSLVRGVAEILTFGANKYGDRNWEKGMLWSRPYGAALRHLFDFWNGQDFDEETAYLHLKHTATNIAFLIEYYEKRLGTDDRPIPTAKPPF